MKKLIVDYRISDVEKFELKNLGYEILVCPPSENLYSAVCGHPDMLLHIIDINNLIVHKDIPKNFINNLIDLNINVAFSNSSLRPSYPFDVILNAVNLPNLFIHFTDYTDRNLLNLLDRNKRFIKVKQGYTKCSTAIVNDKAIITSDSGIARALYKENIDVLLLPPGDIELPGLDYGFIGGTCGLIEKDVLAFYGNLDHYAYGKEVMAFLKKYKVEPVFLRKDKLIDRGSIFAIGS